MFNTNSGYIGHSRSVRSLEAIEDYEIPISLITKELIEEFLKDYRDNFSVEEIQYLKRIPVLKWKFVAKEILKPTSWHHTGKYFNKTNHYSLEETAEKLLELKDSLNTLYKESKKEKINKDIKYGVISVQDWGGTFNKPYLIGSKEHSGIVIDGWLYYKCQFSVNGNFIKKVKVNANKTEWIKEYNTYPELVKNHEKYKGTVSVFNEIIKEKLKK